MNVILDILILLFLDVILSVDNAILIASTTKDLEDKPRRTAQILGAAGAVLLRLIFVILILLVVDQVGGNWLYLIGGIILIVLGWMLTNESSDKEKHNGKAASNVLKAVALIMAGDFMLSFDNAFIIADFAYNIYLDTSWVFTIVVVAIALFISLLIILFSSSKLSSLMNKHTWIIYIAAWLLMSVGIEMSMEIFGFGFDSKYIEFIFAKLLPYAIGGTIVYCKYKFIDNKK